MIEETNVNTADNCLGPAPRKTRLALMGEFSAGKSTLSKLFLGDAPLPVRVTATRLPPIWISQGEEHAIAVGHDGTETPVEIDDLVDVRIEDTRLIRLFNPSETLEICDLIDMPGISDPNMSSDVWLSVMDSVDSVVWCTQATQAWRQSEAAVWEQISHRTNGDNILLITQMDKIRAERDVERVLTRVRKETDGLFKAVYPLSILKAIEAGDDEAKWQESGASEFVEHLVELLLNPAETPAPVVEPEIAAPQATPPEPEDTAMAAAEGQTVDAAPMNYGASSVIPKRVRVLTEMRGRTMRPSNMDIANL